MKKTLPFVTRIKVVFTLLLFCTLYNCNYDDNTIITDTQTIHPSYSARTITKTEIQKNPLVRKRLEKFTKKATAKNARIVTDSIYGFTIDTDTAIYIENGSYHSYTFPIRNTSDNGLEENLLLSVQEDGTYDAFIVIYTLTTSEKMAIHQGNYVSLTDKATFTTLDNYDATAVFNTSREIFHANGYCYVYEESVSQGTGWNILVKKEVPCPDEEQDNAIDAGDSADGGGTTYDTGSTNYDNSTIDDSHLPNTSSGGGMPNTTTNFEFDAATSPIVDHASMLINILGLSRDGQEAFIVNNILTGFKIAEILDFLEVEGNTQAAIDEAKLMILEAYVDDPIDPKWDYSRTGVYRGKEALRYHAAYTDADWGGSYTMFKLDNGHILCESANRRLTHTDAPDSVASNEIPSDGEPFFYVKINDIEGDTDTEEDLKDRWYQYRAPALADDCIGCDLDEFFTNALGELLKVYGRYVIPVEDVLIVVTGKDFDNIDQSKAVSGSMLVVEIVGVGKIIKLARGVKYIDEGFDAATAIIKYLDEIYETQKQNVRNVIEGIEEIITNKRKGNFGEMATDVDLTELGYNPLHNRVDDLDQPLSNGIDGIFQNPRTNEYIIVESKYGSSTLGSTMDGKQMSDGWIQGSNRLVDEVGEELAEDILDAGYTRVLSKISPDGSINYFTLNSAGNITGIWFP